MGSRNPDRIPLSARRSACETVGQMLAQRWEAQAHCLTCRTKLRVDIKTIALVRGPGFSLWNKLGRCRAVGCRGRVVFYAKAPGMDGFQPMTVAIERPPEVEPAWIRNRRSG